VSSTQQESASLPIIWDADFLMDYARRRPPRVVTLRIGGGTKIADLGRQQPGEFNRRRVPALRPDDKAYFISSRPTEYCCELRHMAIMARPPPWERPAKTQAPLSICKI
jgi:hypothetical protein